VILSAWATLVLGFASQDDPLARAVAARGGASALEAATGAHLVGTVRYPGATAEQTLDAYISQKSGAVRAHLLFREGDLFRILLWNGAEAFERVEDGTYRELAGEELARVAFDAQALAAAVRFPIDRSWKPGAIGAPWSSEGGFVASLDGSGRLTELQCTTRQGERRQYSGTRVTDGLSLPTRIVATSGPREEWTLEIREWTARANMLDSFFEPPRERAEVSAVMGSSWEELPRSLKAGAVVLRRWREVERERKALEPTAESGAPSLTSIAAQLWGSKAPTEPSVFRAALATDGRPTAVARFVQSAAESPDGWVLSILVVGEPHPAVLAAATKRLAQAAKMRKVTLQGEAWIGVPGIAPAQSAPSSRPTSAPTLPRWELVQRVELAR